MAFLWHFYTYFTWNVLVLARFTSTALENAFTLQVLAWGTFLLVWQEACTCKHVTYLYSRCTALSTPQWKPGVILVRVSQLFCELGWKCVASRRVCWLFVSVAWPRWDTAPQQGLLLSGQLFLWHLYTYFTCEHVTCTCTCLCVRDLHGNTFSTLQDLALLADTFVAQGMSFFTWKHVTCTW